jgi:hypothetical protein
MRGELAGEVAVGARPVLDHDRLAEARAQRLTQRAGNEVGRTARRERHQQADRPRGIGLRRRGAREHREECRKREANQARHDDPHDAVSRAVGSPRHFAACGRMRTTKVEHSKTCRSSAEHRIMAFTALWGTGSRE